MPYPKQDILFITDDIYRWLALDELATCAYSVGDIHIGYQVSKKLLEDNLIPDDVNKERIFNNYKSYEKLVLKHQTDAYEKTLQDKLKTEQQKKEQKEARKTRVKRGTKTKSRKVK